MRWMLRVVAGGAALALLAMVILAPVPIAVDMRNAAGVAAYELGAPALAGTEVCKHSATSFTAAGNRRIWSPG